MWTLTGFADEISPDLNEQLQTLETEGIRFVELRSMWDTNVLRLTDDQVTTIETAFRHRGIGVSAIGSPIGKINITDDFAPHQDAFERALVLAKRFGTNYIRIFSFFIPPGEHQRYRNEVMGRLRWLSERAATEGIMLLHENEKDIYGDVPERCLDIVEQVGTSGLQLIWDPANFVQCGVAKPHDAGYDMLRPYIRYVHVKDAEFSTGRNVPAGEGDGQLSATVAALRDSGFTGFFSMEPHLKAAGTFSGFSGPDLFRQATDSFKRMLEGAGVNWN